MAKGKCERCGTKNVQLCPLGQCQPCHERPNRVATYQPCLDYFNKRNRKRQLP